MGQHKPKIVRLGTNSSDEFIRILNEKNIKIQELLLKKINDFAKTVSLKVMLGDGSVTDQETFDPLLIQNFYQKISQKLEDWNVDNVSITNNEDLRRIFVKFHSNEGNYIISVHFSLQFHVLLYYKPIQRVIECQKELSNLIDKTKNSESHLQELGDKIVIDKLKKLGYADLNEQQLFEVFFENDKLREKIYQNIEAKTDIDFQKLSSKKIELFNELDSLLIETYKTSSVIIDDAKLISGEEGCLCTIDLEYLKKNIREGNFDPKKISAHTKDKIAQKLDNLHKVISLL